MNWSSLARGTGVPVVRRTQAYSLIAGVVLGILVAGLAIPLAFGESLSSSGGGGGTGTDLSAIGADDGSTTSTTIAGVDGTVTTLPVDGGGAPLASTSPGRVASGGGTPTRSGGRGPTAAAVGPLAATDRGVSADTIKVGAVLLDVATVGRMGVGVAIDPAQQQKAFEAFFDDINDRGGINGRKIEGHFRPFDVTNRDDQIAACRELTQEKQVFVILAGFNTVDPNVCIVEENQTPLLSMSNNNPDWVFQRAGGRLLSMYPASGRLMSALVAELQRTNLLGKKIGILTDGLNDPGAKVADQLKAIIEQKRGKVVYRGLLSDEIPTASSQTPVEVNRMQSAGAELVVFLQSNAIYGTQFVNQASRQNYKPIYVNTDWASGNGDSTSANMPQAYQGALAFSFNRGLSGKKSLPPTAINHHCRDIYDARNEKKLSAVNTTEYGLTQSYCDLTRLFEALATKAGPNLTRQSFLAARSQIGTWNSATWSDGVLSASKFDMADLVRTQSWDYACKCWLMVDAFHRPGG